MTRLPSSSTDQSSDHTEELSSLLAELAEQPDREPIASELEVLQSIYGEDAIRLWYPSTKDPSHRAPRNGTQSPEMRTIRYVTSLTLPSHEDVSIRLLVSLPPTYPSSAPPQLQLLSRYVGAFGADSNLFGSVLRTFISMNGVEWTPDTVCVFDGLQSVLERCTAWYEERLSAEKAGELVREDTRENGHLTTMLEIANTEELVHEDERPSEDSISLTALPDGIQMFIAESITDRKSVFVGRACRISHPAEVPLILSHLMTDRRISRAAHPIINAWRCQVGNLLHQDNDDDGESAAGGRLGHLLQILDVNNVLVIVTRYFGGIHLGPDRFKHINQAARNALEVGGFLDAAEMKKNQGRGKKH